MSAGGLAAPLVLWDRTGAQAVPRQYVPTAVGYWWFRDTAALAAINAGNRGRAGHVGLIRETDLGEQRHGDAACEPCQRKGVECWAYKASSLGSNSQVKGASDTVACARCKLDNHASCTLVNKAAKGSKQLPPPHLPSLPPS